MDFITIVKDIYSQMGVKSTFYAVLCDYRAFDEEEPWMRYITKTICDEKYHQQLVNMISAKGQWTIKVTDMIYKLSNQYGYQTDMASEALHKMALGLGVVDISFNWDKEFGTNTGNHTSLVNNNGSTKKNCPYCGRKYYKIYSTHCAFCGRKR